MNLLNAPHAIVVRDGKESKVTSEELVQDDVVLLSAGEQICADATVLEGNVQVNESLLTGESDEIDKKKGDTLLSGSFVVSGRCHARLDKVGNESYISKLTSEANRGHFVLPKLLFKRRHVSKEHYVNGCGRFRDDSRRTVSFDDGCLGLEHDEAFETQGFAA